MTLIVDRPIVVPANAPATQRGRILRWIEFLALFIAAPLAIALFLPPRMMFQALAAFSIFGLALLALTGGFDWRAMARGWSRLPWREAALMGAAVVVSGVVILALTRPAAILNIPRHNPQMLAIIWVFYPLLSALPQELIFRALFFHRYGNLMPSVGAAMGVNAGIFAFAHLMYWSATVLIITFIGGWLFARAYLTRGFPSAWLLHALAGNLIFTVGMGAYFWTGNVVRPF